MCGRYTLTADLDDLQTRFAFMAEGIELAPQYNIAPTEDVLTVVSSENEGGEKNEAMMARWGFVSFWANSLAIGGKMINARAETLLTKSAFKEAFLQRRCLVLADGFYDWRHEGKQRIPLRFTLKDEEPFAFAGIYATWRSPSGERVRSCSIITTETNELGAAIHDRMPVILPREAEEAWMDPEDEDVGALSELLLPYPSDQMRAYEVSTLVNSPRNNSPECIAPIASLP